MPRNVRTSGGQKVGTTRSEVDSSDITSSSACQGTVNELKQTSREEGHAEQTEKGHKEDQMQKKLFNYEIHGGTSFRSDGTVRESEIAKRRRRRKERLLAKQMSASTDKSRDKWWPNEHEQPHTYSSNEHNDEGSSDEESLDKVRDHTNGAEHASASMQE